MGPGEGEVCGAVIVDIEAGRRKSVHGVTLGAFPGASTRLELSGVLVEMARRAILETGDLQLTVCVTRPTFERQVEAFEPKSCLPMVEFAVLGRAPFAGFVALFTARSQSAFVHVLVTLRALGVETSEDCETTAGRLACMARGALGAPMRSCELELRAIVVEQ